jgi:hypothetical protein
MTKFAIMRANREKQRRLQAFDEPGLEELWRQIDKNQAQLMEQAKHIETHEFLVNWDGECRQ